MLQPVYLAPISVDLLVRLDRFEIWAKSVSGFWEIAASSLQLDVEPINISRILLGINATRDVDSLIA